MYSGRPQQDHWCFVIAPSVSLRYNRTVGQTRRDIRHSACRRGGRSGGRICGCKRAVRPERSVLAVFGRLHRRCRRKSCPALCDAGFFCWGSRGAPGIGSKPSDRSARERKLAENLASCDPVNKMPAGIDYLEAYRAKRICGSINCSWTRCPTVFVCVSWNQGQNGEPDACGLNANRRSLSHLRG